uniref:ATP-dependent DNA helicase n=2 Tax=Amphimedon queenslandica TaxID=400682 RepID=A0A1X7VDH8_AMPQE
MFINGVGGTGKSFLIEAIKCLVDDIWHPKSSEIMCAIVAPTGIAAFNVGGLTIHRLFQLPIEHEGKAAGYWALSKEAQKRIKMTLKNLKIIIVDEVSMVSNLNLAYLHMRLEDIFGTDEWFGSKNILFVGDLLQLPPVNGRPVFNKISNKLVKTRFGAANAVNIWKETVEYDELTINERQKGDETFFKMLDSDRHGCLTDDTIDTLKSRVFNVSIQEKYKELESEGTNPPICLFSKVDACQKINELMLESLETEKIELACVDVVDESGSTAKFDKKQEKKLEKLKDQPSKTAGLETVLSLAVGCRVMLRRNIDVTVGLVNGAIGTVMGIYATRISIKFDHIDVPCDIERVTSRFMLSKNLYILRKQFPLILSYAITIHKCQGLSLDTAIIDLLTDVFGDGMAYVALSHVRTLNGLHLLSFDPLSVKVSNPCINEINRLRTNFRNDLPQIKKSKGKKRKIQVTGIIDDGEPCSKNAKVSTSNPKKDDVIFTSEEPPNPDIVRRRQWDYVYYPGNEEYQRRWCEILNLKFVTAARILPGSPTTPLSDERVPNSTLDVPGDGNCLFYALSYLITGSISQHYKLRKAIVSNMPNFEEELFNSTLSATRYSSIYDYINKSKMYRNCVWATDTEIITLSAILGTTIYSYSLTPTFVGWARYGTQTLYGIPCDTNTPALYLKHVGTNHFQAVKSINIS